jgi:hypothetical protein
MQSIGKEKGPLFGAKLAVATVRDDAARITMFNVLILGETRKSPLVGDKELLATGKLVLRTAKSFQGVRAVGILRTDGEKSLADFDACNGAKRFSERATHTSLEPIRASARKHFVNAQHMEGMGADTKMERVLACVLGQILVARHAGGLERLGRELLLLIRHHVGCEGELVDASAFASQVKNANLGVGDTAAVA